MHWVIIHDVPKFVYGIKNLRVYGDQRGVLVTVAPDPGELQDRWSYFYVVQWSDVG